MGPLMQISGTVPIVFVIVPDPVGAGYINSLARPNPVWQKAVTAAVEKTRGFIS